MRMKKQKIQRGLDMIGLLNFGSLVLGLIAWILPVVNLTWYTKNWVALSIMSISACGISLFFQIFNIYNRVKIEDWSVLMDTLGAMQFSAVFLFIVTFFIYIHFFFIYHFCTLHLYYDLNTLQTL